MTSCDHAQTKFVVNKAKHEPMRMRIVCRKCSDHARDADGNPVWSSSEEEAKQVWADYQAARASG